MFSSVVSGAHREQTRQAIAANRKKTDDEEEEHDKMDEAVSSTTGQASSQPSASKVKSLHLDLLQDAVRRVEENLEETAYVPSEGAKVLKAKLDESNFKKKPKSADCHDLQRLWDALRAEMAYMKKELMVDTQNTCDTLRSWLKQTEDAAGVGIKAAGECKKFAEAFKEESTTAMQDLRADVDEVKRTFGDRIDTGFENSKSGLDALKAEVQQLSGGIGHKLELLQSMEENDQSTLEAINMRITDLKRDLGKTDADLRKEVQELMEDSDRRNAEARVRMDGSLREEVANIKAEHAAFSKENQKKFENVSEAANSMIDMKLMDAMQRMRNTSEELVRECRHDYRMDHKDMHKQMLQLCQAVSSVANLPTRRVEWIIRDACGRFHYKADDSEALPPGSHCTVQSKHFEIAGSRGLQFELVRIAGPNMDAADRRDCLLRISAEAGLSLMFRVSVGDVVEQYQHVFEGGEPFVSPRLCELSEQIQKDDDTLTIGLEVLEAFTPQESESTLEALGMKGLIGMHGYAEASDDTSFVFHRYVNHRMLDLVQDQVDVMNSRMTRRVEWRVENGSKLGGLFPEGEAMCSATFQAAGLDGLQLIFYPSGSSGAKEGHCSCFVVYPGRSQLRCWLSVGSQRREAKLFNSAGFFGRTNFCRLENGIDPATDTILIVLEIEEAQQDTMKYGTHQLMTPGLHDGPLHNQSVSQPTDTVQSTLTMQKASGHLQEVKKLPSIWTASPHFDAATSLDGFHSMKDLATKKRANLRNSKLGDGGDMYSRARPGTTSSMSMYSQDMQNSRPESRQRPRSRVDRAPSPDKVAMYSMYADMPICPPATARPANSRDANTVRYAAYVR